MQHVQIGLYAVGVNGHDHKHSDNLLDAQMSAPVAAALAIVDGDIAATSLPAGEPRRARKCGGSIEASDTQIDDECERIYPGRRSGVVRIDLADGRSVEERVLDPKGEGENPMTDDDLKRKFTVNCEPVIGKAKCEPPARARVWNFDNASADVAGRCTSPP